MPKFDILNKFSPLPIVDIQNITRPCDGLFYNLPQDCVKYFHKGNYCEEHYKNIASLKNGDFRQCPNGFASYCISFGSVKYVLTGFIPFPRLGGEMEKKKSKKYPNNKISQDNVITISRNLINVYKYFIEFENDIIDNASKALHDIRKLNQTVKQTAERLLKNDASNKKLLTIYKASDMMSQLFDIIEFLANEKIFELEPNTESNIFDLIYKCIQVNYIGKKRIDLDCDDLYRPRAKVHDKTITILPNVLVSNAIKYSKPNSRIKVSMCDDNGYCMVKVINETKDKLLFDDSVFDKGTRFHKDTEGTGKGLYVAKQVAVQHNTDIKHREWQGENNKNLIEFSFKLKTLD